MPVDSHGNQGGHGGPGHPAMDYREHHRTYRGFLVATKWTVIFLAVLLAGMAFFLT